MMLQPLSQHCQLPRAPQDRRVMNRQRQGPPGAPQPRFSRPASPSSRADRESVIIVTTMAGVVNPAPARVLPEIAAGWGQGLGISLFPCALRPEPSTNQTDQTNPTNGTNPTNLTNHPKSNSWSPAPR